MIENARRGTRRKLMRALNWTALAGVAAAALWYAFAPRPILVETSAVASGPMEVTVDQQGEVRVHDRFVTIEATEKARTAERSATAAVEAARSRAAATRSEEQVAAAALLAVPAGSSASGRRMRLTSPARGQVLRVLEKSEKTVSPGTPVMVIGDPARFEVVVDVLSTDAVKIKPGAPARIERWGGDESFAGRVRVVEPYAFTKVSSLGIEEKRVNVVIDPLKTFGPLGDGYRVEARIVIWSTRQG